MVKGGGAVAPVLVMPTVANRYIVLRRALQLDGRVSGTSPAAEAGDHCGVDPRCIRSRTSSVHPITTIGHSDTAIGRGMMRCCPSGVTS